MGKILRRRSKMNRIARLTSLVLLVALCVLMLAACGVNSYSKKLEKAGYEVTALNKDEIKEYNETDSDYTYKGMLGAIKADGNVVYVVKMKSKSEAKSIAKELGYKATVEVKGKIVIAGTEDGVKAAIGK